MGKLHPLLLGVGLNAGVLLFYPTPTLDIHIPSREKIEPVSYFFLSTFIYVSLFLIQIYPFSFFFISYMHKC